MRDKTDSFAEESLLRHLRGAPWPATRDELIEYAARTGAALQLLEELYALPAGDTRYAALETLVAPISRVSHDRGVA
jgi:hypothetical protein